MKNEIKIRQRYDRLIRNLLDMMVTKKVVTPVMQETLAKWLDNEWDRLKLEDKERDIICQGIPENGRAF